MIRLLKCAPLCVWVAAVSATGAQSLPADTGVAPQGVGFSLPRVGGSLNYGVSASEIVSTGFYDSGTSFGTNLSGDVAYVSKSQYHPFSAVYAGGVLIGNSRQPTTTYQSLSFSQVLSTKHWNITLEDSISLLPESPVGGLSGVPGTGDLGVDPVAVGSTSGIGVLTTYGPRVSNTFSGTVGRQLTGKISTQASGMYAVQRFIGANSILALDTTTEGGSAGLSYHFSARDSLTGNYNYSNFSYSGNTYSFYAQGATLEYSRQWTRRLTTDVYAGPQIIGGSSTAIAGTATTIAAGASASYQSRTTGYSVAYSRGANNGSGVVPGSFSDSITGTVHRQFGKDWILSGDVGYAKSSSLPNFTLGKFESDGVFVGGQGSRRLGRFFSAFLTYSLQHQTYSASGSSLLIQNAFSGVYQVVGLGISYSPRSILLGR